MTALVPFSVEEFVDNLLRNGAQVSCDDTNESFCKENRLPEYYDQDKFKRGQRFYHHHVTGMFLGKLMGLITILAIPTISAILEFTKMSSEPLTAYRRYLSTIFHMTTWYEEDFTPSSKLWQSLKLVKGKHNNASRSSCYKGMSRISQMDMALTQFGFMGFQVSRSESVGIHNATAEEFEDFIHVWKVIGHIMGIEEKFNICRDSRQETKDICDYLIKTVFNPAVKEKSPTFVKLSKALIEGMWCMIPYLQYDVFSTILLKLLKSPDHLNDDEVTFTNQYKTLTKWQVFQYSFVVRGLCALKNSLFRKLQNQMMYLSFWLMKKCPFLAFYKFGKENSYVHIFNEQTRNPQSG